MTPILAHMWGGEARYGKQRFKEGESLTDIAVDFSISPQRVWQIVREHLAK